MYSSVNNAASCSIELRHVHANLNERLSLLTDTTADAYLQQHPSPCMHEPA